MLSRVAALGAVSLALLAPSAALAQDADPVDAPDLAGLTDDLGVDVTDADDDASTDDDVSCDDSADDDGTDADALAGEDDADDQSVADARRASIRQEGAGDDDSADDEDADYGDDSADDDACDAAAPVATKAVLGKLPKLSFSKLVKGRKVALGTVTTPSKGRVVQQLKLRGVTIGSATRSLKSPGVVHLQLSLTKSGRRALKKAGKMAKLTLRTTVAGAKPVTKTVVLSRS